MAHQDDAPQAPADGPLAGEPSSGPAGSWHTWWRGDAVPPLAPLPGLQIAIWREDDTRLAQAIGVIAGEVAARRRAANRMYRARIDGMLVGYGWVARGPVEIQEVRLRFTLPVGHRYIWHCVTLAPWRGRGIYPRLLQAMMHAEGVRATTFWIGHAPGNRASARGMRTAGFQPVLDFDLVADGTLSLSATGPYARAAVAARVLGLPPPPATHA